MDLQAAFISSIMLLSRMMVPFFFFLNKHETSQGGCNVIELVSVKLGNCLA